MGLLQSGEPAAVEGDAESVKAAFPPVGDRVRPGSHAARDFLHAPATSVMLTTLTPSRPVSRGRSAVT